MTHYEIAGTTRSNERLQAACGSAVQASGPACRQTKVNTLQVLSGTQLQIPPDRNLLYVVPDSLAQAPHQRSGCKR